MDQNHLIVVIKVMGAYIHLLVVLAYFTKGLTEYEESEVGVETEDFTMSLSTLSNGASASHVLEEGEASSKKRKRKDSAPDDD